MGDIIQESRAALSRYTRAASSESAGALMGKRPDWVLSTPTGEFLGDMSQRILTGPTTSPVWEVRNMWGDKGFKGVVGLRGSPLRVADTSGPLLYVTFRKIESGPSDTQGFAESTRSLPPVTAEVVSEFLFDSLVKKRTIRNRRGVSFFTLRTWRSALREYQLKAFRALKMDDFDSFAGRIAKEILDEIDSTVGVTAFRAIVPIPCGHSKGRCFSVEIARQLGQLSHLPVVNAFARQELPGSSHPRENVRRPPLQLVQTCEGPIILVDDVATSGKHMEEAVKALRRSSRSIMAIAWIGSDGTPSPRKVVRVRSKLSAGLFVNEDI